MSKQLNKALSSEDGTQHEPTEVKSFWFMQPIQPVNTEHQQFLDKVVKATATAMTTDVNNQ